MSNQLATLDGLTRAGRIGLVGASQRSLFEKKGPSLHRDMPIACNQKLNRACSSNLRLLADSENPVPPKVPTPYG